MGVRRIGTVAAPWSHVSRVSRGAVTQLRRREVTLAPTTMTTRHGRRCDAGLVCSNRRSIGMVGGAK
jgi:hypothetical protein